jgi:macrolide transport system ATP-binding/permease protein
MIRKFLNLFRPHQREGGLPELESHRSQATDSPSNAALVPDRKRVARVIAWLETTLQDMRYGLRQLAKAPALVAVAVLSLALGIGANTAVFTLINAVMLRSLPVRDPARLVLFYDGITTGAYSGRDFKSNVFSYPFWQYLQTNNEPFESLAAFRQGNDRVILHIRGSHDTGPSEQAIVHLVSGNYFEVLGVHAAAGRVLTPSDESLAAPRVAILSYPFWRDRFRLDPAILGHEVVLNGTAFAIVGVADREFFGERVQTAPDFWLPLSVQPEILRRESWRRSDDIYWLNFIGRMRLGLTLDRAQSAMNLRLHQFYLDQAGGRLSPEASRRIEDTRIQLKPGGGGISGLRYLYSTPLHILIAMVAIVLLITCANIATILLARGLARRQEFLARLALGASRGRLLRQVLTESILLSVIGGIVGAGFAWWGVKALVLFLHVNPVVVKVRPDPTILAFTFALSVLTGILFGIFPALRFSRLKPRSADIPKSAAIGKWRFGAAQALIALQVALSLILLLGAGLLAHSLLALEGQNIGFRRDNVLVIRTDASLGGYKKSELSPLYRDLGDRLSEFPGVISASICRFTPQSGNSSSGNFSIEGYTEPPGKKLIVHDLPVAPRFFETLGIPLLLGRTIGPHDTPDSPAVAIVNQSFVNQYLPNQNALGQRISLGAPFKGPGAEIVGVVADSKYYDLREQAQPMVFFSLLQQPVPGIEIALRTSQPFGGAANARQALKQVSNTLPILSITTLDAQIERSLEQQKLITVLCGVFGLLALILASLGVYGTLAYAINERTVEIGIRMAIGAQRHSVVWIVLRDSFVVIALGLVVGLPLSFGATRWLKSFLFGVPEIDPPAIACAVLLIFALALPAGYFPARRAARIDPVRALRHE